MAEIPQITMDRPEMGGPVRFWQEHQGTALSGVSYPEPLGGYGTWSISSILRPFSSFYNPREVFGPQRDLQLEQTPIEMVPDPELDRSAAVKGMYEQIATGPSFERQSEEDKKATLFHELAHIWERSRFDRDKRKSTGGNYNILGALEQGKDFKWAAENEETDLVAEWVSLAAIKQAGDKIWIKRLDPEDDQNLNNWSYRLTPALDSPQIRKDLERNGYVDVTKEVDKVPHYLHGAGLKGEQFTDPNTQRPGILEGSFQWWKQVFDDLFGEDK